MGVDIKGNGTGQKGIKLDGGRIDMYKTTISGVHKGMSISEGTIRMFEGSVEFTKDYGISLNQGGVALKGAGMTYTGNNDTADFIIKVQGLEQ